MAVTEVTFADELKKSKDETEDQGEATIDNDGNDSEG
jgi:hypothetical protein